MPKLSKRIGLLNGAKDEMTSEQSTLASDTRIEWAELQEPLERTKRGHLPFITRVFSTQHRSRPTAIKSSQLLQSHKSTFKDPFFRDFEWYLKVDADHSKDHSVDMKIDRAWDMGFTGKGIVVSIVDDGEHNTLLMIFFPFTAASFFTRFMRCVFSQGSSTITLILRQITWVYISPALYRSSRERYLNIELLYSVSGCACKLRC